MTRTMERNPWAIPPGALTEWLALAAVLEDAGTVPCRTSDTETWWPDKKDADAPSTRMAVRACWRCPARQRPMPSPPTSGKACGAGSCRTSGGRDVRLDGHRKG